VFAAAETSTDVRLEFALEPVVLEMQQAMPCGLILQELLSNALKHAFAPGTPGSVHVELCERDGCVMLVVRDDGAGFPPGFDPDAASSLGLRLIRMLAEQLGAEIEQRSEHGARTSIRFARQARTAVRVS
jgi:two-component sensor histidine kinase